jgi:hypothetical protein
VKTMRNAIQPTEKFGRKKKCEKTPNGLQPIWTLGPKPERPYRQTVKVFLLLLWTGHCHFEVYKHAADNFPPGGQQPNLHM